MLDSNILPKGEDYESLGETYVIFITENDALGDGRALYNIERCLVPDGRPVNDGAHILYVNASIQDDTALGRLMLDMSCKDPKQMHYKELSKRVEFLKSAEGGFELMCELSEKLISFGEAKGFKKGEAKGFKKGEAKGLAEGSEKKSREVAINMLKKGYEVDAIADVLQISVDEVQRIVEA